MAESEDVTAVVLAVGQTVSLWTVLCPPLVEIRRHNLGSSPEFTADVRQAEFVAGTAAIAIALVMSMLTKNLRPIVASSVLVTTLLIAYEYTLRQPGARSNLYSVNNSEEAS